MISLSAIYGKYTRWYSSWVVLIALMLATSVRASAAQLQEVPFDPGLQGASQSNLVSMLNMKQTVDGQTVTLDYAYADSNRISYSLTATGTIPLDRSYRFGDISLTDDAGHPFQMMFGGGGGGGGYRDGDGGNLPSNTFSYSTVTTSSLDASVLTNMPDMIHLRLTAELDEYQVVPSNATPEADGQIAQDTLIKKLDPVFDFTIPFIHGQVIDTQQSITANGITLRLDRLVIAPSMTRGMVCIDPTSTKNYEPSIHLLVDKQAITVEPQQSLADGSSAGCYDLRINESLDKLPGHWALSIDSLDEVLPLWTSTSVGSDGATYDYRVYGSADDLARLRPALEAGLNKIGMSLTESDGSLKLNFPAKSDADLNAVNAIVNMLIRPETPGPWVFTFDVPPK